MDARFTTAESDADLKGILALQRANLRINLTSEEIQSEGFVTVEHTIELLRKMNDRERHIIAKVGDQVIGYVLAMTALSRQDIPVLQPMFDVFDGLTFRGKQISEYPYIIAGQACVAKAFRGMHILDGIYSFYRQRYAERYAFLITEIALTNQRSLNAHRRIGFLPIHRYTDSNQTEWEIVVWDWRS